EVYQESSSTRIVLSRSVQGNAGFRFDANFGSGEPRVTITELGDGPIQTDLAETMLDGEDARSILGLIAAIEAKNHGLLEPRRRRREATIGKEPLTHGAPHALAEAIVATIAPIARELERRSGAPGELVLRRSVASGRRDEIFITKDELLGRVFALPGDERGAF